MNVLIFGMTDNPGGIESVIMNYFRKINRKKYHFDFLCNTTNVAYESEILALGGNIYRIAMRSQNRKRYYQDLDLFFSKNAKKYDAIWVNVCSLANIDYLIYAKKYGIKKRIIHCHNSQNMDSFFRGVLHKINKIILPKYATDFWSCSKEASKWFFNDETIKSSRYSLIHNAIDVNCYKYDKDKRELLRKKYNLSDKFIVGNIGRLHFQKNQKFLLDIFAEIKKIKSESILMIVGDGEDRNELYKKSKELGISNEVCFLGTRNDVPELLQIMDVFVFPSLFEGLSLSLLEAQASSLPTFTSKGCVSKETKMTDFLYFISLKEKASTWAEIICSTDLNRDNLDIKGIRDSGYDIDFETRKLEKCFDLLS